MPPASTTACGTPIGDTMMAPASGFSSFSHRLRRFLPPSSSSEHAQTSRLDQVRDSVFDHAILHGTGRFDKQCDQYQPNAI